MSWVGRPQVDAEFQEAPRRGVVDV